MTNLKQRIQDVVDEEVLNGGFEGEVNLEEFDRKPCFSGSITMNYKEMTIEYNPEYEKRKPGKIEETVADVTRHEIDHKGYRGFKGCPRDEDKHAELIFEPIANVLMPKDYGSSDVHYIANALEDTILHVDLNDEFPLDGINNFFEEVGNDGFSEFYEAHTKLNLALWGRKKHRKELRKYWKHKDEIQEVLKNFLERTGISNLKKTVVINGKEVEVKDRDKIRRFLNNEENWPKIATIYAEEFSKLMKPGYAMPLFNHSGKGTKGKESVPQPKKGEPPKEGNPFDKVMYSPEFKQRRVKKAHYNGEGLPSWMDSFEAMDLLYQSFAQRLNIKVESYTKQGSMPIIWYGQRDFDPDKDNLKHITFGFDDKGKVKLKKKMYHEDEPLEYKVSPKGFPQVRFCLLDTSGTMKNDPDGGDNVGRQNIIPWGDNSRYHHALVAFYGLLEYLKDNHLLKQTGIALGNFSSHTYLAQGLREAKKLALTPQFGTTIINLDAVKEMFRNREMLVFTVSDGAIHNWSDIKDDFIKLAKEHHYFHLQIGPPTSTSMDLENNGLKVVPIRNAQELADIVIDLTDNLYRGK